MLDTLFLICAVVGGATFLLRTLLLLIGGDDGGDGHDVGVGDHDSGTNLLSIQAISAFLLIFGLVGLALTRGNGAPPAVAVPVSLAAGFGSMWAVASAVRWMSRLQSSGTLELAQAIGAEGVVYLTVRPKGGGQVQVTVQGRLATFDAETDGPELRTGTNVRVVGVRGSVLRVAAVPPVEPRNIASREEGS